MTPHLDSVPAPPAPLTASATFSGRDPGNKHPEREGRGWGRLVRRDDKGRQIFNEFGEPETEYFGGHLEYARADKYDLDRKVSPLCKSIVEHIIGETLSAPPPKPRFADVSMDQWIRQTGRQRRAIEMAIDEGVGLGIIVRQFPGKRYEKGGYRIRGDKIAAAPLKECRQRNRSAIIRRPREQAALDLESSESPDWERDLGRLVPSETPEERARQIAILERKIAEIREQNEKDCPDGERQNGEQEANASAKNCPHATAQSPSEVGSPLVLATLVQGQTAAQPDVPRAVAVPPLKQSTARSGGQAPALLTQVTIERAPSSGALGALPCPQCGTYLIVLEAGNQGNTSSSVGSATEAEEEEGENLSLVTKQLREYDMLATANDAAKLLVACRQAAPDVTVPEIVSVCRAVIERKRAAKKPVPSPTGYLLHVVPQRFPTALAGLRATAKPPARNPHDPDEADRALMLEYSQWRETAALELYERTTPEWREATVKEKTAFLRSEGRLERMAPDVKDREVQNLILQDLEKQVMPFEEWKKQRESGA